MINLFKIFKNAVMRNPEASRKEAFETYWDEIKNKPAAFKALAETEFDRNSVNWKPYQDPKTKSWSLVGTQKMRNRINLSEEQRETKKREQEERAKKLVTQIEQIILLDLPMPNGKKLRHCKFAEVARFGGFYTELSKHGKPTQIIDTQLSEPDIKNIYSRFQGGSTRRHASPSNEMHA